MPKYLHCCYDRYDLCKKQKSYGLEGGIKKAKQGTTGRFSIWSLDQGWCLDSTSSDTPGRGQQAQNS